MPEDPANEHHDQNVDQLPERIKSLTRELLEERITRIDFQMQLLKQWRDRCQHELNLLLGGD